MSSIRKDCFWIKLRKCEKTTAVTSSTRNRTAYIFFVLPCEYWIPLLENQWLHLVFCCYVNKVMQSMAMSHHNLDFRIFIYFFAKEELTKDTNAGHITENWGIFHQFKRDCVKTIDYSLGILLTTKSLKWATVWNHGIWA